MTKRNKAIAQGTFLLFLIVASVLIIRNHRVSEAKEEKLSPHTQKLANGYYRNEGYIFGTIYHITYQYDKDLLKDIETAMNKVDNSLSMFNKNSVVAQINNGSSTEADEMFVKVFNLAKEVYRATDGCFDPTVGPLVNAWGFGFRNNTLPTDAQVDSLKNLIGFDKIEMREGHVIKQDSAMVMDFSAIAKGFGVDCVAEVLKNKGIKNYMVEIGGEVIVKGKNQKGNPWRVGIAKPIENNPRDAEDTSKGYENGNIQETLELDNKAMATSGNYMNYYIAEDGRKLAHTIDPHSGYPVQHTILSSTVFAPTCAKADAFATAFMVMGLEKAKRVLQHHKELEVYFIYADEEGKYQVYRTIE